MKQIRLFLMTAMLACAGIAKAATDKLSVQDVRIDAGSSMTLDIVLENETTNLMGFQCDIVLEEGLTLKVKSNGKPTATLGERFEDTGHTISSSVTASGAYRFIATSLDGDAIPDTDGTLFSVTLQTDESLRPASVLQGIIEKIEFNTLNNQKLIFNDVSFSITINGEEPEPTPQPYDAFIDGIYYNFNAEAKTAEVTWRGEGDDNTDAYSGELTIPEKVTYKGVEYDVTSIKDFTFNVCPGLTSVTIPASVTSLSAWSFNNCNGLTFITVDSRNPVYDSREGCNAIIETATNKLIVGSNTTVIPASVTGIEFFAFIHRSGLTSIFIHKNVTDINYLAFAGCGGLESIEVETGNPNYDSREGCNALIETSTNTLLRGCKNTRIPNGIVTIGQTAFNFCPNLTEITIPETVRAIDWNAFFGDTNLTDFYCHAVNPPTFDDYNYGNAFEQVPLSSATLHVPAASIETYSTTEPWASFGHIVALIEKQPCATPTIGYKEGRLTFHCETEGATFHYDIQNSDIKSGSDSEVALSVTYIIKVYATCDGYTDSDVTTATLCWVEVEPQTEGITDDITVDVSEVKAMPLLIQRQGSTLTIQGIASGTPVCVYDLSGRSLGSATASANVLRMPLAGEHEPILLVKVGEHMVKIAK